MFAFGSFDDVGQKAVVNPATGKKERPDPLVRFMFHRIDTRVRQRLRNDGSAVYTVVLGSTRPASRSSRPTSGGSHRVSTCACRSTTG